LKYGIIGIKIKFKIINEFIIWFDYSNEFISIVITIDKIILNLIFELFVSFETKFIPILKNLYYLLNNINKVHINKLYNKDTLIPIGNIIIKNQIIEYDHDINI